jgi:hypothetical protein
MRFSIRDLLWLMLLAAVVVAWRVDHARLAEKIENGIGGNLKLVPAEGVVTLWGQPLHNASVTVFYPDGNVAMGVTNSQGLYMLTFSGRNGARPGKKLTVTISQESNNQLAAKYASPQTSTLRVDVPSGGSKNLRIDLK